MELTIPGDKSISQRALVLAGLAEGESRIRGILNRGDSASTARALRQMGAQIPPLPAPGGELLVGGLGLRGFQEPAAPLDVENSGTGARLLLGVLAGQPIRATVTGDASLRRRPMARVTDPLTVMGGRFRFLAEPGRLPIQVLGGPLDPVSYRLPVSSAQLKSALLLAGIVGGVSVELTDPGRSRDHTERMLGPMGATLLSGPVEGGWRVALLEPPARLEPMDLQVPGDFSSAAFFLLFGLLHPGLGGLALRDVGLNETRTGLLGVLERMGGRLRVENVKGREGGEPLGDLIIGPGELRGVEVGNAEIPTLIDEVPILAVGAARAQGVTRITGARELRVKETDRIHALVQNLRGLGIEVEELDDGLEIQGSDAPLRGRIDSFGDHRIAMAFGVLGALPGNDIEVVGEDVVEVSFPGFWELLASVTGGEESTHASSASHGPSRTGSGRPPVITLDGPAGSGKSTTAREVARRLGFTHLDSGALYRALTYALLSAAVPEEQWPELTVEDLGRFHIWLRPAGAGFEVLLDDQVLESELRSPDVTARVSPLSALPAVRAWLLGAQRRAGMDGGVVADGRDMGTVVFPHAEVKVFLTADLEERARRRFLEREGRAPTPVELEAEALRIEERDARDSRRVLAPLRRPEGALEVDTSHLSFERQVEVILDHVKTLTKE
ncbi:3-phosphoshikimate 1-carboxyvinyltransferase [Gemmatimonadota bacterium]